MSEHLRAVVNRVLGLIGPSRVGSRIDDPEDLLGWAERQAGLDGWGDDLFREGLNALLQALEALPGLSPLGVVTYENMIRQALVNRLRFLDEAVPRHALDSPVIITGLPRSGTTALHRFLALDTRFHAPPLWELLDPFAQTGATVRRLRTAVQIAFKNRLLPDLDRKHYTRADTPEECTLLLANSLASPLFWDLAPLDGYLEWYQATPQRWVYEDYRRQLEVLQARHPNRRLLLKAPAHLGNLTVLAEVVPEASLIQTHRDPTACFFSHCSLRDTLSSFVMVRPDRVKIAGHVRRVFEHDLAANIGFHEEHPDDVIHVACRDLAGSPLEILPGLHAVLDLEWSRDAANRVAAHVEQNPRGRFGRHRVSEDGWGVPRETVDLLFSGYRERFAGFLSA